MSRVSGKGPTFSGRRRGVRRDGIRSSGNAPSCWSRQRRLPRSHCLTAAGRPRKRPWTRPSWRAFRPATRPPIQPSSAQATRPVELGSQPRACLAAAMARRVPSLVRRRWAGPLRSSSSTPNISVAGRGCGTCATWTPQQLACARAGACCWSRARRPVRGGVRRGAAAVDRDGDGPGSPVIAIPPARPDCTAWASRPATGMAGATGGGPGIGAVTGMEATPLLTTQPDGP